MKYVGAAAGLFLAGCGDHPTGPTPIGKITVTGRLYDTDISAGLSRYRITIRCTAQDVTNGAYSFEAAPGVHRARTEYMAFGDFLSPMEVSVSRK